MAVLDGVFTILIVLSSLITLATTNAFQDEGSLLIYACVVGGLIVVYIAWRVYFLSTPGLRPAFFYRPFPLVAREVLTEGSVDSCAVHKLTFSLGSDTASLASMGVDTSFGDFLSVKDDRKTKRSYSPSSPCSQKGTFDLVVKMYGGTVSGYLERLQIGEEALVSGPGPVPWLSLTRTRSASALVIAFGVGITEAFPVVQAELETSSVRSVTLMWGCKGYNDFFWHEEVAALQAEHGDRLQVIRCVSREDEKRQGYERCRIDGPLIQRVFGQADKASIHCLVVGTKQMKRMTYALLDLFGFHPVPLLQKKLRGPWNWR